MCNTLRTVRSNVLLGNIFLQFFIDLEPKGVPGEDPETTFSATFFTLPPRGIPERPQVAKRHPKDTKMTPRSDKNDIKIV